MKEKHSLFWHITIFVLFIFWATVFASQEKAIIENPEKPLNKNAGRVIQLKEVIRVKDEEGKFYFSGPWDIVVARDGSFFIHEPNKIYKFDANGKFVKNFYKKGEGPGELNQNLTEIIVREDNIILASSNMYKIIRLDMRGNLIEDIRPEWKFSTVVGYYNGKYFLTQYERKSLGKKISEIREENLRLVVASDEREITPTPYIFPVTVSINVWGRGISSASISRFQRVDEDQRYVYLFHTPEYLVKLLDLEKIEVIRSFRRKYDRVKRIPLKESKIPLLMPKFHNDIYRLAIHKNNLWVITSTVDKEKGILVDVFNREGKYLDNFYLPLRNIKRNDHLYAPMAVYKDFLYVIEIGEDELISVAKYEIHDEGSSSS
ncbi:MAG: 6-bladed beta-propeller [Candidatus Aminicenantes bacterium]|nr:6-bladed beta-propeller [Candidatus Aminicenantes bacterium]MDH5704956.1 6-bladed beta-propeller [Candidatus Aminicenantes bacterium]